MVSFTELLASMGFLIWGLCVISSSLADLSAVHSTYYLGGMQVCQFQSPSYVISTGGTLGFRECSMTKFCDPGTSHQGSSMSLLCVELVVVWVVFFSCGLLLLAWQMQRRVV